MAICNRKSHKMTKLVFGFGNNNFVTKFTLLCAVVGFCCAAPAPASLDSLDIGSENLNVGPEELLSYYGTVLLSVAVFIGLVVFAVLCTGGRDACCFNVFDTRRERDVPTTGFSVSISNLGRTNNTSPNVRALEMGQIEFEPLPQLNELSPTSCHNNLPPADETSSLNRGFLESRVGSHPSLVVTNDGTNIYVHDSWLEEPSLNFPRKNIEYVKEVGQGWFGQVIESEAEDIVPYTKKLRVLVKVLGEGATGPEQMRFLEEARLYRDANHGNILKLLGHSIEKLPFLLIMEQCPQGNLKAFLIANVAQAEFLHSQGALLRMGYDIARGLEWMASADFVHKDLAARNCQVASEGRIVIGDYGLAAQDFHDDYYWDSNSAIPLRWCAPETLHCTTNTVQTLKVLASSNVWTYGVLLWEIFEFGKLPYSDMDDDDVISRVINDKSHILPQLSRPDFPLKEELHKIMFACWNPKPELRLDIRTVVEVMENLLSSTFATASPIQSPSQDSIDSPLSDTDNSHKDEFDRKWAESASKTVNSTRTTDSSIAWKSEDTLRRVVSINALKKKSVSFTGLKDPPSDQIVLSQSSSSVVHTPVLSLEKKCLSDSPMIRVNNNYCMRGLNNSQSSSERSMTIDASCSFLDGNASTDVYLEDSYLLLLEEEDDSWKKQKVKEVVEPVDVLQKEVRRKSLTVQDFMILTPTEKSNFSDQVMSTAVKNEEKGSYYYDSSTFELASSDGKGSKLLEANVVASRRMEPERDVAAGLGNHRTESSPLDAVFVLGPQWNSSATNSGSSSSFSSSARTSASRTVSSVPTSSVDTTNYQSSGSSKSSESIPLTPPISYGNTSYSSSDLTHLSASVCFAAPSQSHATAEQQSISIRDSLAPASSSMNTTYPSSDLSHISATDLLVISSQSNGTPEQQSASNNVTSVSALVEGRNVGVMAKASEPTLQWMQDSLEIQQDAKRASKKCRKTSTPNHLDLTTTTTGNDYSSLFERSPGDVFEDFTMELTDRLSPISKPTSTTSLHVTRDNYDCRSGNAQLGPTPSEELDLRMYQMGTMELLSESASHSSESCDYFSQFRTSAESREYEPAGTQGMALGGNTYKSGFQTLFGEKSCKEGCTGTSAATTCSSLDLRKPKQLPVARKLDFDFDDFSTQCSIIDPNHPNCESAKVNDRVDTQRLDFSNSKVSSGSLSTSGANQTVIQCVKENQELPVNFSPIGDFGVMY